ncbi:disintegrin and metalloproteinase domain-containing protein 8 [Eulemur rufifrons]|uniref:disintegrin and metalloproteinase domain-containing protein 8 n=1 Tax=Eulemur rufifrons TaxID=859984 RepID=UPI00374410B2
MRGWGLWLLGALWLQGPVPGERELRPGGPRAQLHPAPAEEQGTSGLELHGDLHGQQRLRGDRAGARAGPLPLPGPRGGAPALGCQPQHLCGPQVCSAVHLIEPLDGAGETGRHALYLAQHLQQKAGTCGVSDASLDNLLGPRVSAAFRPRPRNGPLSREPRFVELYVVTDSAEFQLLGSRDAVRKRVLEVVNHVDKLYQELNFRVALVGLEVWSHRDKFYVSHHANVTLENFLAWRARDLVGRQPHDNVQLITAVDFTGTTVGLAKVSAMCSRDSGAVNQDHSRSPVGVASTIAHEMGHNLGMDHDENVPGCHCPVPRAGGGCIMAASIGSSFPRTFSHCSRADLETFVEKPRTTCLANAPDLGRLVGGPVCGNRFVERGEQCDCGPPEDCRNRCCNTTTCQLAAGAQCAHGACCHECRVKQAAEPCRPQKDECDLEEFCDGRQPECPEDAFRENGTPCLGGYCYNGSCPTLAGRCQDLCGPGARAAAETCFSYSISAGCGVSVRLSPDRVKCGILFCDGGLQRLERSTCTVTYPSAVCRALATDNGDAYEPVPTGTQCGHEKVCNHKKECHCHAGWAPPHCAKLLADVQAASGSLSVGVLVALGLLAAVIIILAGVIVYRKARSRAQRNLAPKTTTGLFNPLFHQGAGSESAKEGAPGPTQGPPVLASTATPSQPPRTQVSSVTPKRPPPAPPAAVSGPPLSVPVYTRQAPGQGAAGPKVALKPPVQRM